MKILIITRNRIKKVKKLDFNSIEDFIKYTKQKIEQSAKIPMDKLKERAKQIVDEKIYGAYPNPKIYQRMNLLTQHFKIKYNWEGDTYVCTLYVEDIDHPYNSTWIGKEYSFDEIINDYFTRSHTYYNGETREGVDTLELTNEMIETGEAMRILLNELKKYFDIV